MPAHSEVIDLTDDASHSNHLNSFLRHFRGDSADPVVIDDDELPAAPARWLPIPRSASKSPTRSDSRPRSVHSDDSAGGWTIFRRPDQPEDPLDAQDRSVSRELARVSGRSEIDASDYDKEMAEENNESRGLMNWKPRSGSPTYGPPLSERESPAKSRRNESVDSSAEVARTKAPAPAPAREARTTTIANANADIASKHLPHEPGLEKPDVSNNGNEGKAEDRENMKSLKKQMGASASSREADIPPPEPKAKKHLSKSAPSRKFPIRPPGSRLAHPFKKTDNSQSSVRAVSPKISAASRSTLHTLSNPTKTSQVEAPQNPTKEISHIRASQSPSKESSEAAPLIKDADVFPRSLDIKGEQEKAQNPQSVPVRSATSESEPLTNIPIDDLRSSSAKVEFTLMKYVDELRENHALRVKHALPRQRRCYAKLARMRDASANASLGSYVPTFSEKFLQKISPFSDMESIQVSSSKVADSGSMMKISQEVFQDHQVKKPTRSYLSAPTTRYKSSASNVPFYHDCVILGENVLAENHRKLLYWPYFEDEELDGINKAGLWAELDERYDMINEYRPRHQLQAEQCRLYKPYTETFLQELGITWQHILFWLLAEEEDIKNINSNLGGSTILSYDHKDFESLVCARGPHCEEDFDRTKRRWQAVLSKLAKPSIRELRVTALACTAFLRMCGFSLWHLARQSDVAQLPPPRSAQPLEDRSKGGFQYRSRACKICQTHECFAHGEIKEEPDSEPDDHSDLENPTLGRTHRATSEYSEYQETEFSKTSEESQKPSEAFEDKDESELAEEPKSPSNLDAFEDSETEKVINYRKRVLEAEPKESDDNDGGLLASKLPGYSTSWFKNKSETHLLHKRKPFYPCSHEGSCEEAQCRCFREKISCEKNCACPKTCRRRFHGCTCAKDPRYRVCGKNSKCECRELNRECDADLCGPCGAAVVLDPVNRYDEEIVKDKCSNCYIQRNVPKRTILGLSEVHGFGLYVGEKVKKDEYLGEYKGEVVTTAEASRRGTIYHHLKTNYLFQLNKNQEVDSTRMGNKFRFINNSSHEETINCYPHVMLCNTIVRIGMFAKRNLSVGEELFFNYGYPKESTKGFWEKGEKPNSRERKTSSTSNTKVVKIKTKRDEKYSETTTVKTKTILSKLSAPRKIRMKTKKSGEEGGLKSSRSIEEKRAQTAKARAVHLAKQRALKLEKQQKLAAEAQTTSVEATSSATMINNGQSDEQNRPYRRSKIDMPLGLNLEDQIKHIAKQAENESSSDHSTPSAENQVESQSTAEIEESSSEDETYEEVEEEEDEDEESEVDPYEIQVSESSDFDDDSDDDEDGGRLRNSRRVSMNQNKATRRNLRERQDREERRQRRPGAGRKRRRALDESDDDDGA